MNLGDLSPVSRDAMRPPASGRLIIGSLLAALLLDLMPWHGIALLVRPDFLLVMLLYWAVHEPRDVGQGTAFMLALLADVADSALLGQHPLVYVMSIFLVQVLRLRILQLSLPEQAIHIGAVLAVAQGVTVLLNVMLGRDVPGLWFFAAPLLGGALWPFVGFLTALLPFRRPPPTVMQ